MSRRRKRRRPFPTSGRGPRDDDTIVYKISGGGEVLVGGETVFVGPDGIQVLASISGNYEDQNAYTFIDDDGYDIGGLYARDDAGQNLVSLRVVDPPGNDDDCLLQVVAEADNGGPAEAQVSISATREGESDGASVTLSKDNSKSEIDLLCADRVRISPVINLLGASLELCDVYIKGSNFIIKYNDGGTTRYKYLDLSGTGTSWTHSTTEP